MNPPKNSNNPSSADGISEQSKSESQTQKLPVPERQATQRQATQRQATQRQATPRRATEALESLDPQQTSVETAALAAHLQRSGIMWLPRPHIDSIQQIAARFPVGDATPEEPASSGSQPSNQQVHPASNGTNATPPRPGSDRPARSSGSSGTPNNNTSGAKPAQKRTTPNRPATTRPASRLQGVPAIQTSEREYSGDPQSPDQRTLQLKQLEQTVESCTRCPALASCRNKTVFGVGNPSPRFVFFGEAPGEEEDSVGQPFVGRAGELLTKMMQACTLQRDEVYILNTVKCRPPGNRNPEGDELSNCRSYYQQQFHLLRPEYIICLGAVSGQELLGTKLSVGRLRGTFHQYFASKVLVTYHPSYLLRNPAAKKAAWADLQYLMRDAGIAIPPR